MYHTRASCAALKWYCFPRAQDDASRVEKSFPTFLSCLITGALPLIAAPIASAVNMPSLLNVQPNLTTNQVTVADGKQTKPKTAKQRKRPAKPSNQSMQKKIQLLQQPQQPQQQQQYLPSQQPTMMFGQSTQQQQQQQSFFQQTQQQRGLQAGLQPQHR